MRNRLGSWCVAMVLVLAVSGALTAATDDPHVRERGATVLTTAPAPARADDAESLRDARLQVAAAPLHFERNDGQAAAGVRFVARGAGYAVLLSEHETVVALSATPRRAHASEPRTAVVRSRLVGSRAPSSMTGEATLGGTVSYYRGRDRSAWQQGVPTYGRVRAAGVYPGIDAIYYGNQRSLQYDFLVAPGADPTAIAMAFDGIDALRVAPDGDLVLAVDGQELRQEKPYTYQDGPEGRREIASRFVVDGDRVGFAVGDYDVTRPLVIDPVLTYSSYFGGDSEEAAFDVALGPGGSVYITGITEDLASLPTLNAFQPASGSQPDAFITKFVPNGASLSIAFSSYLGGSGQENVPGYGWGGDIAVDAAGTAYVTGSTRSADFPVTAGAQDASFGGFNLPDAFFAKVSTDGLLQYATYLGGTGSEVGSGIALGPGGVAYIYGATSSDEVTEQSPVTGNAYDQTIGGGSDAFVARYTAAGALDYFTFIGGNGGEAVFFSGGIAVDAAGLVYVVGETNSSDNFLPANGFDTTIGTLSTASYILKLNTALAGAAQAVYASYVSGTNGQLWATGVAVTGSGLAYVVGETSTTTGFPIKNAVQPTYVGGNRDAFVMKVDTTQTGGNSLLYSTYLGGDQADAAYDVAVDNQGRAVVVGSTFSSSVQVTVKFPLVQQVASCPTFVRISGFVTVFNSAGTAIDLSSCYASSYPFYGVATGSNGEIWLAGVTNDSFTNPPEPTGVPMVNAEQGTYGRGLPGSGGDFDVLLVRIAPSTDLSLTKAAGPNPVLPGASLTYTLTLTNAGSETASTVTVSDTLPAALTFTSCVASNGGVCGGTGNARTVTYGSLAPGASSTITIVAGVNDSAGAGATISNTAVVSSATHDPNPANDTATAAVSTPTLTPSGDADGDGLTNEFETRYGLNPFAGGSGNGPNDDPDADGRTNLQEQGDGTHPRGFVITYLAEGATGAFFDTRLAIANPTSSPALVLTRFQKGDGTTIRDYRIVPAMQRATIDVEGLAGLEAAEFSTLIEADVQVVADRTMTWDQSGYGSHAERGILTRTATKWYFAEGATFFNFNLFYLIQNPNTQTAQVRVTYLLPSGAPLVKDYVVQPQSRFNIWVDSEGLTDPALAPLASAELSAVIESTNGVPIIAERAMYLDQPGRALGAGHESAGVTSPATQWFLAEGATGTYFDLFILIANPQTTDAAVQADFLLSSGQVITKTYTVPASSRFNIWVDLADPDLADAALSTRITSTNGVPIIVERAMWWPGPTSNTWQEAHNSPGEVTTGTRWAIAEGETGGARSTETYVLIANTSAFGGTARVTVLFEDGSAPITRQFPLAASSRSNVAPAADFPETAGKRFGMLIESIGGTPAQIVVERAMYSDSGGVRWAAGTNALATKLP
jgi:uncharacterized repeat protein (TIGR01451 family)